jgi:hypothetical protein
MLEMIAIVLLVLWILGMVSSHTLGGFIHCTADSGHYCGSGPFFQGKRPR